MEEQKLKILLVDDDEDDFLITEDLLGDIGGSRYVLEWAGSFEAGLLRMAENCHDIYLVDYRLGRESGVELLRWAVAEEVSGPVIVLTGQGDHDVDMEAMEAGAADYLVKGQFDAQLLERSIRYAVERHRAQVERLNLEADLRQAQKMEAIGHMAGGIAHDFNNVLTAILSYASLARRNVEPNHPVYSKLVGIEESSQRAAELTHQLLAFARRQVVAPRALDLNEVVINLDKLLRRLINADIELVTVPGPALSSVKVDPGQMEQVLVNLVVNARDAMPDGGKLTIRTSNEQLTEAYLVRSPDVEPGDYVCLSVNDTGTGMTEAVKSRIFDPFFTTKEPGKGTGLGLATCYGIVKQNNGHIHVDSRPGEGTTFEIFFPSGQETPEKIVREQRDSLPMGDESILLVEDEPAVRQIVTELLEQQGYSVTTAVNGEDALRFIENQKTLGHIDLLLTDIVMPRLTGTALADKIKMYHPNLKIVFMSGYADEALAKRGVMEEAGTTFIQKPFTIDVLARKIRQVLEPQSP